MKTTVEIADALFERAKAVSRREGVTVRALIEEGLRRVLAGDEKTGGFRLRQATFAGNGIRPEIEEGSWEGVRELIYHRRGG